MASALVGPGLTVPRTGRARLMVKVPLDPRPVGLHRYWQCLFLESNPARLQLSNVFDGTVGS